MTYDNRMKLKLEHKYSFIGTKPCSFISVSFMVAPMTVEFAVVIGTLWPSCPKMFNVCHLIKKKFVNLHSRTMAIVKCWYFIQSMQMFV